MGQVGLDSPTSLSKVNCAPEMIHEAGDLLSKSTEAEAKGKAWLAHISRSCGWDEVHASAMVACETHSVFMLAVACVDESLQT